jgi:hypothetical protein
LTLYRASGLFYFDFSLQRAPIVEWIDLSCPVLDFWSVSTETVSGVWVTLDNGWRARYTNEVVTQSAVVLLHWIDGKVGSPLDTDHRLLLVTQFVKVDANPLSLTLNDSALVRGEFTSCTSPIVFVDDCFDVATPAEVEKLELYVPLATLPKSKEEEAEGETGADEEMLDPGANEESSTTGTIKVSKDDVKKAERDKTRELLKKKLQGPDATRLASSAPKSETSSDVGTPSREVKKPKLNSTEAP